MQSDSKSPNRSNFWDTFADLVRHRGVPAADVPAYVEWAQAFAKSQPGPLRERSAADVHAFLGRITLSGTVTEQQHAREALSTTMIYTHVLNRPGISVRSPADRRR